MRLVGGGSYPQPGEILMAQWCFILDELPEFKRDVLEVINH
jgi:predicted ATPase with chaperone activity